MPYILNIEDGVDVLHRKEGLTESCNTDQIEGRQEVDDETAKALITIGSAKGCLHCKPFAD